MNICSFRRSLSISKRYFSNFSEWHQKFVLASPETRDEVVENMIGNKIPITFQDLNKLKSGLDFSMKLRESVLSLMSKKKSPELKALDNSLKEWLSVACSADVLQLRMITFADSSGDILEKVARGEAVHRVRSLSELKRRLHDGRRCFGLFHPSLPSEPLAFVHIALTEQLAPSLSYLNSSHEVSHPTHAMYYSVNSPHPSLTGLELALRVIKEATLELRHLFPTLNTFSTLSPIPGFRAWFSSLPGNATKLDNLNIPSEYETLAKSAFSHHIDDRTSLFISINALLCEENSNWCLNERLSARLKPMLLWCCAHYLSAEKLASRSGMSLPLDPVARFHLRNGATLHSVNWMGNPSMDGMRASAAMMVNYKYDMDHSDEQALAFENSGGHVPISPAVQNILSGLNFNEPLP